MEYSPGLTMLQKCFLYFEHFIASSTSTRSTVKYLESSVQVLFSKFFNGLSSFDIFNFFPFLQLVTTP